MGTRPRNARFGGCRKGWPAPTPGLPTSLRGPTTDAANPARFPTRQPAPWVYAGVVLALVAAPVGWTFTHPRVRVLNLTPERLIVSVDGKTLVSIDPTSAESPAAGLSLRFPSGRHTLTAKNPEGRVVYDAEVTIRPGAEHLWAPAASAICFWLEQNHYGRARAPAEVRALVGVERFWALPPVDTWFAPNPPESEVDARSSGGSLWALRQAPCSAAPASVRALASPAQ